MDAVGVTTGLDIDPDIHHGEAPVKFLRINGK